MSTADSATSPASRVDILYVEDDAELRASVCETLREEGYSVAEAENGLAALEYLHASAAPSLILLDINMPVMDGRQFLARIQQDPLLARTPVTIVSANVTDAVIAGPHCVLFQVGKPFEMRRLLGYIRRSLSEKTTLH